jgi:hypothetical protein
VDKRKFAEKFGCWVAAAPAAPRASDKATVWRPCGDRKATARRPQGDLVHGVPPERNRAHKIAPVACGAARRRHRRSAAKTGELNQPGLSTSVAVLRARRARQQVLIVGG